MKRSFEEGRYQAGAWKRDNALRLGEPFDKVAVPDRLAAATPCVAIAVENHKTCNR